MYCWKKYSNNFQMYYKGAADSLNFEISLLVTITKYKLEDILILNCEFVFDDAKLIFLIKIWSWY